MEPHVRKWLSSIEIDGHGTAPLPAVLAESVHPLPVYVSYSGGKTWFQVNPWVTKKRRRVGYKLCLPEIECIGDPRGGLCFLLSNEGFDSAHWTPRGSGVAVGEGHCWFDSVRQELNRELPSHPAANTDIAAVRQWFAVQIRDKCRTDCRFADALNRFVVNDQDVPLA